MAPPELFVTLILRAAIVAVPVAIGLLALRRLFLSETLNAWVYALMVGYSAFSVTGLLPWALGFTGISPVFVLAALAAAPIWIAIVVVCGLGRRDHYDLDDLIEVDETESPNPLVLTNPILPPAADIADPVPVFRHHRRIESAPKSNADAGVLSVARAMRGRASSEARRVRKLLPPPSPEAPDLPFLR